MPEQETLKLTVSSPTASSAMSILPTSLSRHSRIEEEARKAVDAEPFSSSSFPR